MSNEYLPDVRPWPLGAYAPGGYQCKCHGCGTTFIGDKRAFSCLECALKENHVYLGNLEDKYRKLMDICKRMVSADDDSNFMMAWVDMNDAVRDFENEEQARKDMLKNILG